MTKTKKPGWLGFVVLLAAFACAGVWATDRGHSVRDRSEVASMTKAMKTICVGRYLIDMPVKAVVGYSDGRIAGFAIETIEESEAVFRTRVAAREAEIAARGPATDGTGGMVDARDIRIPGMFGRTFIYGRNHGYLMEGDRRVEDEYVSVEAHAHLGRLSISLSSEFADEVRARLAEAMLARLRLRGEDEIPSVPGFCVWRAVFVEPLPVRKAESTTMFLGLPGHPDLAMALASMAGGGSRPGLLARVAHTYASSSPEERLRVFKLRSGKRSINGLDGEEVVARVREYNFTTGYAFNWETRGLADDVSHPYLSLELQTGLSERAGAKPTATSLHEDALITLWDSIASSIRLRKSGPAPAVSPPPAPPG